MGKISTLLSTTQHLTYLLKRFGASGGFFVPMLLFFFFGFFFFSSKTKVDLTSLLASLSNTRGSTADTSPVPSEVTINKQNARRKKFEKGVSQDYFRLMGMGQAISSNDATQIKVVEWKLFSMRFVGLYMLSSPQVTLSELSPWSCIKPMSV